MISRKGLLTIFVVILTAGLVLPVFGQIASETIDIGITVTPFAAIKAAGPDLTFSVGAAAAGELPVITPGGLNAPSYVQYSSIVPNSGFRRIDVKADAAMPLGLKLNIRAGTPTGHGGVGTPLAGGVMIDSSYVPNTDQPIINGITSCATGSGTTQGPAIHYTLFIDEATFGSLDDTGALAVTIAFTIVAY